jgi:glyoxylase-like metal-dependent hydrolase (beta-lactamase superfamily II)
MSRVSVAAAAAGVVAGAVYLGAQQPDAIGAALAATGADRITSIRYSGFGSIYWVGQNPDPKSPWPRVTLKTYDARIDYAAQVMEVDYAREAASIQPRGGGRPFTGEQRQQEIVSGGFAWDVPFGRPPRAGRGRGPVPPGPEGTPAGVSPVAEDATVADAPAPAPETAPAAAAGPSESAEAPAAASPPMPGGRGAPPVALAPVSAPTALAERVQQIRLTPHGFLKAAAAAQATVTRGPGGVEVSFTADGRRFVGTVDAHNQVERVQTWVADPVLGDMLVEVTFSGWDRFGDIAFPTHITERRGGFPSLDLFVATVEANPSVEIEIPDAVRNAVPAPAEVTVEEIGRGVYYLRGGSHHSVAIEMNDHVVLVEAPLDEARSLALMDAVQKTLPGKPVRVVVNTHHHFDHAGGLRTFVDAGATIVTHEANRAFLETAWAAPRTLAPDRLSASGKTPMFQTFTATHVLTDGVRRVELHRLAGNPHHDGFAMVYLPDEKILIEADAFTPSAESPAEVGRGGGPAAPPGFGPALSPSTVNLFRNIERLGLQVAQIAALHGPRLAPLSELAQAAGAAAD